MKFRRGICNHCGNTAVHSKLSYLCKECLDKQVIKSVKSE